MNFLEKKIELFANVAIIVVAVVLIGVMAYKFWGNTENLPVKQIQTGEQISLADVNWAENKRTLVMVLQEGCRFCTESAPFYRRLAEKAQNGQTKLLAVFPDSVENAQKYLNEQGIGIKDIKQSSLDKLNIRGTPTLILADEQGKVVGLWIGKLTPGDEEKALQKIFCNEGANCG